MGQGPLVTDLQRAADRLRYRPEVRLLDGLRRTWEWFEARESALTGGSDSPRR